MSDIRTYYSSYANTRDGFDRFHNEVINMPRESFSDTGLSKIKSLASYFLLLEDVFPVEGATIKEIMEMLHDKCTKNIFPMDRDIDFENKYLVYSNIESQYESQGRMFRHLISLCDFFGFFEGKSSKTINFEKCKEYAYASTNVLMPIARNNIISLNAKTNNFIKHLKGIDVEDSENVNFRPAYAILKYMQLIERPVTKFELSVLLGRIDAEKVEDKILERALKIGKILPADESQQIEFFFKEMGWMNKDGSLFRYGSSQQPYFKINVLFVLLEDFDLIKRNNVDSRFSLTNYAVKLLSENISSWVADLELLLERIESDPNVNRELNSLILSQRKPELLDLAKNDKTFIKKMNQRSLTNVKIDSQTGKKIRNPLIAELAKIRCDYKCQYKNGYTFKQPDGRYYVEAHHILEFNGDDGPDIINNMVVLGPEAHMMVHHGSKEVVQDVYTTIRINGGIEYDQIREMVTEYNCINSSHVNVLLNRKVITNREYDELIELLNA